jgi:methylglutaconyl-CoA hydratase
MEEGHVNCKIDQKGLATIEFGHPSSNALPGKILSKLANAITEASSDDSCRLILLKSAGNRAFCAGASFDELIAIQNIEDGKVFFSGFAKVINACRTSSKLIIGRIHGKAVGGGVGIASAVDYAFATKAASIKLSELAVGIGPFVVGPAVERKIGLSGMSDLAINATAWRSATWAEQKGLYAHVYEDIDQMDEGIAHLVEKLTTSNPAAMEHLKTVFWNGTSHWDQLLSERAEISGKLVLSDFTRNAIQAFKKT